MTSEIIPAGESGQHTIRWEQMLNASGSMLREFEKELRQEAEQRRLQVSWREDRNSGDVTILWRPDELNS